MKLAFCLYNYFPYGGMEKNLLAIAHECLKRGHSLHIFTMNWQGEKPAGVEVIRVPRSGMTNHSQANAFSANLSKKLARNSYDLIMGFNKMPGIDLYYAADVCYVARVKRQRSFLSRLTPRYRLFSAFERAVFSPQSSTEILILSDKEKSIYQTTYGTPDKRFHDVPPGVNKKKIRSVIGTENRKNIREKLGLAGGETLLLMVGSHFKTKGVDRSIRAVASLPLPLQKTTHLFIIGKGDEKPYRRISEKLGIAAHVHFLGTRDDVPLFLAGADFLLQASRTENTGNAIVEALVAGVPVLATESCGYAFHIERARAGKIIPCSPFRQENMNDILAEMLCSQEKEHWQQNAISYADHTDLYNRLKVIVDIIESVGARSHAQYNTASPEMDTNTPATSNFHAQ